MNRSAFFRHWRRLNHWFNLAALAVLVLLLSMPVAVTAWQDNAAWLTLRTEWVKRVEPVLDPPCRSSELSREATGYLEGRLQSAPADMRIARQLGAGRWLTGQCEGALEVWSQAADRGDPGAAFQLFRLGQTTHLPLATRQVLADYAYDYGLRLGPSETAMAWFERSFATLPLQSNASQIASRWRAKDRIPEVLELWQTVAAVQPETQPDHWWALAEISALNGDWQAAAENYAHGASLGADAYAYWIRSGAAWESAEQWTQAVSAYEQARQLHPDYGSAYLRLGHVSHVQKHYAEALVWYQEVQRLQPDDVTAYYYTAEVYLQLGQIDQAQAQIDRALQLDSTHQTSWYLAAQIARGQGKLAVAEADLLAAIQYEPNARLTVKWWIELGDWRRQDGECAGAGEAYRRAGEVGADQTVIEQHLVELAKVCGQ